MKTILSVTILFFSSLAIAQPGTLDSTFGTNGITLTGFYLGSAIGKAIALRTDGKIVMGGTVGQYPDNYSSVVQYQPNGQLDSSFGVNGKVNKGKSGLNSVAIQTDGKILLQGYSLKNDTALLMRYLKNGTPDNSFGDKGTAMIDNINGYLAIQADAKIIVAGMVLTPSGYSIAVARYKKYGKIDSSFGINGKTITGMEGNAYVRSVAIQSDGKIVVGGSRSAYVNGTPRINFAITRYNPDGTLDTGFGINGTSVANFADETAGHAIAIQPDGKIIITGYSYSLWGKMAIARYNKNGRLDSSFGNKGLKLINFDIQTEANAVAIQPDGKIVVAGNQYDHSSSFALARCNKDGSLDSTFHNDGKLITAIGWSNVANALAIQTDAKILVGGWANDNGNAKFVIARYNGGSSNLISKHDSQKTFESQKNNNNPTNIYISPNPVKNVVYVRGLNTLGLKIISLIDNSGRVLQKITTTTNSYSFNVSKLAAGIHFIKIEDKTASSTLKFIKE